MQSLQDIYENDDNEEAYDLLAKIERFHFLFLVCVLCDILKIINRPEIYFQKNILSIKEFTKEMKLCITQLDLLYEGTQGYYLKKLLDEFNKEKKEYKGYLLIYINGEETDHIEDAKKMIRFVKKQIEERFNHNNEILENFSFLEISHIKDDLLEIKKEDLTPYKNTEIINALNIYNKCFSSGAREASSKQNLLNKDLTLSEWKEFKIDLKTNYLSVDDKVIRKRILKPD